MLSNQVGERISVKRPRTASSSSLLSILTGIVFLLIVIAVGAIAWSVLNPSHVPRTSAERDLARLELVLKNRPGDPQSHAAMGGALMRIGSYTQAAKHFKQAIKIRPAERMYYSDLAKVYGKSGQDDKALEYLAKAKKLDPQYEDAWFAEGQIYLDQRDYKKAVKSLARNMELQPTAADTHYFLGQAFEGLNNNEAAIVHYSEALKYMPDYPEANEALARLQPKK